MPRISKPEIGANDIGNKLDRCADLVDRIKAAMENRGLTVGDIPFADYPDELRKLIGPVE